MKKKIHIISHTHWDREWYLSSQYVNRWIPVFFNNLFRMLEKEPDYRFVLDGQTSIIDDCCAQIQAEGGSGTDAFMDTVKKYIQQGRIIIGPYYLQPDWQLISEEALIRNMLYGKEIAEELGGGSKTGWLLDNFGQISQASQIHEQFGMKGIVVWRGVGFSPDKIQSEFCWESPDGTRLPCVYLLSSYRNGMRLASYPEEVQGRIINEADKIEGFARTDNVLLMNGYDQEMEPDDILPYIKEGRADTDRYQVCQSIPDEYMDAVRDGLKEVELPRFSGPLYSGRYISVFPGILSSRMYLKMQNDKAQRKMEEVLEPLGIMGVLAGGAYPLSKVNEIWKLLLKNHPHDSICGVSVDDVHTDMERRYAKAEKEMDICLHEILKKLAAKIDTRKFTGAQKVFHVFNTTLREQRRQVMLPMPASYKWQILDEEGREYLWQKTARGILVEVTVPAYGFRTLGVYERLGQEVGESLETGKAASGEPEKYPVMENPYIRVTFHKNGTFSMEDKESGKVYHNLGYLEDCADGGDEYNYSDIAGDVPKTTLEEEAEICLVEEGPLCTVVKVQYQWSLPAKLEKDRTKRSRNEEIVPVTVYMTLLKDSRIIRFRTLIRNRCRDHRIRVMFPTKIQTQYSYAQTQFAVTRHDIMPELFDNGSMSEEVKRIVVGARERDGITQFPQRDFAAVTDGHYGVCILNRGLPEYEVLPKDTTMALTLFRSVGWLARTDLHTRIGDAGPEIFTPDAQCLRDMEFHYGISLFEGSHEEGRLLERADEMNRSNPVAGTTVHEGNLPPKYSFCHLEEKGDIRVTAVKRAQNGEGIILRLFHAGQQTERVRLLFDDCVKKVYETNLAEEEKKEIVFAEGIAQLDVRPFQIVSLRVLPEEKVEEQDCPAEAVICDEWDDRREWREFDAYTIPEIVTRQDVEREIARAEKAEAEYVTQRDIYFAQKEKEESKQEKHRLAVLKLNMEIWHRTALEARLSAIYTRKKIKEQDCGTDKESYRAFMEETDVEIRRLADELNTVRVERRAAEYWVDYFKHCKKASMTETGNQDKRE